MLLRALVAASVFASAAWGAEAASLANGKIEHVIVIALENRSFDHMLGWLKRSNARVDGCLPDAGPQCANSFNPEDPRAEQYPVNPGAEYDLAVDPGHSIPRVITQLYGGRPVDQTRNATMDGFIMDYEDKSNGNGEQIMRCFTEDALPAAYTLANEFAVFDRWFSAIPGNTQPNRLFFNSATSHGLTRNDVPTLLLGMPQRTIFQNLDEAGHDWGVYAHLAPSALFLSYPRLRLDRIYDIEKFATDCAEDSLPTYSYLEPRYFDVFGFPANDMHPSNHDAAQGDLLMKELYETIRNSPVWEKSVLLITMDEHGGFFDHVPPPNTANPDGIENAEFDFTRLGIRVPTIAISPWIPRGTVVTKGADGKDFSHSSVPATLRSLFAPEADFLTRRDEGAATFDHIFSLDQPRRDTPTEIPSAKSFRKMARASFDMTGTNNQHQLFPKKQQPKSQHVLPEDRMGQGKLTSFQHSLMQMVGGITNNVHTEEDLERVFADAGLDIHTCTEEEAATFAAEQMSKYLGRPKYAGAAPVDVAKE